MDCVKDCLQVPEIDEKEGTCMPEIDKKELWEAQNKYSNMMKEADLRPFHQRPKSCPYCGGTAIGLYYMPRALPNYDVKCPGNPEQIMHSCNVCGARLGVTKTLKDSNE